MLIIVLISIFFKNVESATCIRNVSVSSRGANFWGNDYFFEVNDYGGRRHYGGGGSRGWNFVEYDVMTGDFIGHRRFDTYGDINGQRNAMKAYIQNIPDNIWVAFGVSDTGTPNGYNVHFNELETLGQISGRHINYRQSFSGFGRKSFNPGEAQQCYVGGRDTCTINFCVIEQCEYGPNGTRNQLYCDCPDGYYGNTTDITCHPCQYPCVNCTSDTVCKSCSDSVNRNSAPTCSCFGGYFEKNQSCQQCNDVCNKCQNESYECTECIDNTNREAAPTCICSDGYFEDVDLSCQSCIGNCIECENNAECLTCNTKYFKTGGNLCEQCDFRCQECLNSIECTQCFVATGRSTQLPCGCLDGFYEIDEQEDCELCEYPCENCQGGSQQCLTCKTTENRKLNTACECEDGFFDDGQECQACPIKCKTCDENQQCILCSDVNLTQRDPQTCECIPEYFTDGGNCIACLDNCLVCTDTTSCTECTSDLRDLGNDCVCIDGYYDSQDNGCQLCQDNCSLCSAQNQCDQCNSDLRDTENNCECFEGYYNNNNNICTECFQFCQACDSGDQCNVCVEEERDFENNCICRPGYYENDQFECSSCIQHCLTCTNDFDCQECNTDLRDPNNDCVCIDGYYNNDQNICQQCDERCVTCENGTECLKMKECEYQCAECYFSQDNCTVCSGPFRYIPDCKCAEGFYEDPVTKLCLQCKQGCKTCINGDVCESCDVEEYTIPFCQDKEILVDWSGVDGNLSILKEIVQVKNDVFENYDCDVKCKSCSITYDNCLSCKAGVNRQNNAPECSCKDGYHDFNSQFVDCIYECPSLCQKCTDQTGCQQCRSIQNLELNLETQKCECKKGYKLFQNEQCIKCYQHQGDCLYICPKGYRIQQGNCIELEQFETSWALIKAFGSISLIVILIGSFLMLRKMMDERFYERHKEIYRTTKQKVQKPEEILNKEEKIGGQEFEVEDIEGSSSSQINIINNSLSLSKSSEV